MNIVLILIEGANLKNNNNLNQIIKQAKDGNMPQESINRILEKYTVF